MRLIIQFVHVVYVRLLKNLESQGLMSAVDFWKINLPSVFCFLTFHTAEVEWSK
jgi:hypothetical protein